MTVCALLLAAALGLPGQEAAPARGVLRVGPWRLTPVEGAPETPGWQYLSKCDGNWYTVESLGGRIVVRYADSRFDVPVRDNVEGASLYGCTVVASVPTTRGTTVTYVVDARTGRAERFEDRGVLGIDGEGRSVVVVREPPRYLVGDRELNTFGLRLADGGGFCASPSGARYAAMLPHDSESPGGFPVRWDGPDAAPTPLPVPEGVEVVSVAAVNRHGHVLGRGKSAQGLCLLLWRGDSVSVLPGPAEGAADGWGGADSLSTWSPIWITDDGVAIGGARFPGRRDRQWVHVGGRTAWLEEEFPGLVPKRGALVYRRVEGTGFMLWVEADEASGRRGGWYEVELAPPDSHSTDGR